MLLELDLPSMKRPTAWNLNAKNYLKTAKRYSKVAKPIISLIENAYNITSNLFLVQFVPSGVAMVEYFRVPEPKM